MAAKSWHLSASIAAALTSWPRVTGGQGRKNPSRRMASTWSRPIRYGTNRASTSAVLRSVVARCCQLKADVVAEDEHETTGRRAILNYGHTFGHAIEWVSELELGHGEAIAVGLVAAAHLAESMGRCSPELVKRTIDLLEKVELPTSVRDFEVDAIMDAMWYDKKRKGKTLRFIIPQDLGDVVIIDNPGEDLVRAAVEKVVQYG